MSLSIENLSFTIWGSGHDATLLDSGDGEVQIFSHPFVPLNSINYAGQYYFLAPDEDGVMFDVVKDDVAHCTFSPALGTSFDTEGEVTVTVNYHREYIHDEETIIVDKTVSQKVMVVDHGTVASSNYYCDCYTDGYMFLRPYDQTVYAQGYVATGNGTKCSSIPWRANSLYTLFSGKSLLTDIEELKYADISNVTSLEEAFKGCSALADISPIKDWDVSNVQYMTGAFRECSSLTSLEALKRWDISHVTAMGHMFRECTSLTTIEDLKDWNTSNVVRMEYLFYEDSGISSLEPLENWDVSKVQNMGYMFCNLWRVTTLAPLANWDVSKNQSLEGTFWHMPKLSTLEPLVNWNTSSLLSLGMTFGANGSEPVPKLRSLHGLENWDVSKVTDFSNCFCNHFFLSDISALSNWDVSSGTLFYGMFSYCCAIPNVVPLTDWDMSNATSVEVMFGEICLIHCSSDDFDYMYLFEESKYFKSSGEFTPTVAQLNSSSFYNFDCAAASGWDINIPSPTKCFFDTNGNYINIPSWN